MRRGLALVLMATCLAIPWTSLTADEEVLFPPPSSERVAELLRELVAGEPPGALRNLPTGASAEYVAFRQADMDCHQPWMPLEELAEDGPASVDADLLRIARENVAFGSRARALHVLSLRGKSDGADLLASLVRSDRLPERYAAWKLCRERVEAGGAAPVSCTEARARHAVETNDEIRGRIERYLGSIRCKEAAPLLRRVLSDPTRRDVDWAARALFDIEGKDSVHELLTGGRLQYSTQFQFVAAAPSPEGIDFLIAHLDIAEAVGTLSGIRDPRALPALEKHLAVVRARAPYSDQDADARQVEDAITIARSPEDRRPGLLAIIEDPTSEPARRAMAIGWFVEQPRDVVRPYEARLATAYARETDPEALTWFFEVLGRSRAPGVTAAMFHHARVWKEHGKVVDPDRLLWLLGRRVGKRFATLDEANAVAPR